MKKKAIVVAIVTCILIGAVAFIVYGRESEEVQFIAIVIEVDKDNNTALLRYAAREDVSNKPIFAKKLPDDIIIDTSELSVALNKDDVIVAYCHIRNIYEERVEVYDLIVLGP